MIIADRRAALPLVLGAAAALAGVVACAVYLRADLLLSHYDARAHLVVSRRVTDNITPGWQQVGAVWLPLPHLLNILPTRVDFFYRTGLFASAISIATFATCVWATARLVLAATGSAPAAIAAAALLTLNPSLLYLQSTPMTEPLLLSLSALVVVWLFEWARAARDEVPRRLGLAMAALAWTRYEGWAVLAAAIAAAAYAGWRGGARATVVGRRTLRLAAWPLAAIGLFLINSRITIGAWLVSGGFYVPDPTYQGQVWRTLVGIWWGTHRLGGYALEVVALVAAVAIAVRAIVRRQDAAVMIPLALLAAAVLPFYAFVSGHPYRIRYMLPLVGACAALAGLGVGQLRRGGAVAAAALVAAALIEAPPWARQTPLILEAQWDRPNSLGRQAVSACLAREYGGEKIMASMGSLAHYMQELSHDGLAIADFLHEGNGVIWDLALETGPAPHAGWMLVEEQAEGGDTLAQRLRADSTFAAGMREACRGGGVTLYRREQ